MSRGSERSVKRANLTRTGKLYPAGLSRYIDGATNLPASFSPPYLSQAVSLAINPATNRVYLGATDVDAVLVLDGGSNGYFGTLGESGIPTSDAPNSIAVNPLTNRVYATIAGSSALHVFGIPFSTPNPTVTAGTTIPVSWSALFGPTGGDYVGIFETSAANNAPIIHRFTSDSASPGGGGLKNGTVNLPLPTSVAAGNYELRLISGRNGGLYARIPLAVRGVPVAGNDAYTVNSLATLTVAAPGVLANDTDTDTPQGNLQSSIVTQPTHGTLSLQANGSFTYTPHPSFSGTDRFTYRTNDGSNFSAPATVTIDVAKVSCGPRPSVKITPSIGGGPGLLVAVRATEVDGPTQNVLSSLNFTAFDNARVVYNGQTHATPFVLTAPTNAAEVSFRVERVTPGVASMVTYTVNDQCGNWPTFVGGGTAAGF